MRRLLDALIAAALLVLPALAITVAAAPAATASAAPGSHYVALSHISPNSACAPDDPGTL